MRSPSGIVARASRLEETESYCHGDKSLEEVTRIIQNRVQLLLNEMKP